MINILKLEGTFLGNFQKNRKNMESNSGFNMKVNNLWAIDTYTKSRGS